MFNNAEKGRNEGIRLMVVEMERFVPGVVRDEVQLCRHFRNKREERFFISKSDYKVTLLLLLVYSYHKHITTRRMDMHRGLFLWKDEFHRQ